MTHVLPQQIARLVRMGLVALALTGAGGAAFAQLLVRQEAHRLYTEQQDYEAALAKFAEDWKKKSNAESSFWIGNCYRMLGNRSKALEWYNKTLKFKKYDASAHLYIAEILMEGNDFKKAKARLLEYKKSPFAHPIVVQRLLASCDSGAVWAAKPAPGKLRSEEPRSDLPTDTATHVLPFDYDNGVRVDGLCVSPDEQMLYFASNLPDGYGGFDIYFCIRNADGSWGSPQNCGDDINTPDDEIHPSLGADSTLYFASNGHAGMGGLDIFAARGQMFDFGKPVNLGFPINSGADDFSLLELSDHKVLFSSNRSGGRDNSDTYSFTYNRAKPYSGFMPASATGAAPAKAAKTKAAKTTKAKSTEAAQYQVLLTKVKDLFTPKAVKARAAAAAKAAAEAEAAAAAEAARQAAAAAAATTATTATAAAAPSAAAPAPEEKFGSEFSLCIEAVDKNRRPLSNASIRLVNKTANKYAFLTTDVMGTAVINLTVGNEYALTISKNGYVAASIKFVMPNTNKRVVARLTLEPLKAARKSRKTAEAKPKQQTAAAQKLVAAAPKTTAPKQLQPATAKPQQPPPKQPQPQKKTATSPQPQAKKKTSSPQPFGSFEIKEVVRERKTLRLFRR